MLIHSISRSQKIIFILIEIDFCSTAAAHSKCVPCDSFEDFVDNFIQNIENYFQSLTFKSVPSFASFILLL